MPTAKICLQGMLAGVAVWAAVLLPAVVGTALAAPARADAQQKSVAGKQVRFPQGTWSAMPQLGPNGKVRQCVLVAMRSRATPAGDADTRLSIDISTGAGLVFALLDDGLPSDDILDEQAEVIIGGRTYPAVALTVASSHSVAVHPGDAAGVLAALAGAQTLRLRSDGAGIDTGAVALDLPADALAYVEQCGKAFNIAIDRPTDPNAPPMPAPRPRAPEIMPGGPVGLAGLNNKQKISGWDASELRDEGGKVIACVIRQAYTAGSGPDPRIIRTFLVATRSKGLSLLLKDTSLSLTPGRLDGTLAIDSKPFADIAAEIVSKDEIALFPRRGTALASALGDGSQLDFKSAAERMQFAVVAGVVPWLRACTHRWGFGFESQEQAKQ